MAPCIIRPHRNMPVTGAASSAPRPLRFSRKCPPPGISQPNATAGSQAPMGGIGCFCTSSFSLTISVSLEFSSFAVRASCLTQRSALRCVVLLWGSAPQVFSRKVNLTMRSAILGAGLAIFTCCAAFGQAAAASPAFEVASVKPAEPQTPGQMRVRMSGGPGTPDFRATHVYECLAEERSDGRLRMVGNRQPVSALTEILGNHLGRPVVDATELKANYDFTVDFAPDSMDGPMGD